MAVVSHLGSRIGWRTRVVTAFALALAFILAFPALAFASVSLTQISSDPFTASTCTGSTTTNHFTEVEPDTYGPAGSNGTTIVAAFQEGRIFDGGACDIGFATSTDGGSTWTHGTLPCVTKYNFTSCGSATAYDRATDPSVAYDAKHGVWLISSLVLTETGGAHGVAVLDSTSTDGITWGTPFVTENTSTSPDKNWIVCDDTATSSHYGNCYTQWDDNGHGNKDLNSHSSDGGQTWSAPVSTRPASSVIGGQPLVQPNGTEAVPIDNGNETALGIYSSTNGGSSYGSAKTITTIVHHTLGGNLREGPLPSAEIDGSGTVYVVWSDCRFRSGCPSNDLVLAKSSDLTHWTISQIPITLGSGAQDYVIPGIAVDKTTSGSSAHLVVTFYYQSATCTSISSCLLNAGSVSSTNGGSSWGAATTLTSSGVQQGWLATTSQGFMVGDYISTSFGAATHAGTAFGVFANATVSSGGTCGSAANNCNEFMVTTTSGLASGTAVGATGGRTNSNNGVDWVQAASNGLLHAH
jgi:hypothetical protein